MFINDTPVNLSLMRELGAQLIDIHSQHQNLLLNKEDFQLNVVDILANNQPLLADYRKAYDEYRQAAKQLSELEVEIERNRENEDFLRFQYKELDEAALRDGAQEELEQLAETMSHAEEIKECLYEVGNILNGEQVDVINHLRQAAQQLQRITSVLPSVGDLAQRLESAYIEMKDIGQDIDTQLERIDFNPQQLEAVNEQLDTIYTLQHKFHVSTVAELISIRDDLKEQLTHIDDSDDTLREKREHVATLFAKATEKAKTLTGIRIKAAKKVEQELKERLIPLGIQNVRFEIQFTPKEIAQDGADKVSFLFSANKSGDMQPISQIASGGEIARVMLSLKAMISGAVKLPTIIFDEIDTGVSGRIAEQMAHIMYEMGENKRQVISITHLPQIAALGTTHYKVTKEDTDTDTISRMSLLSAEERTMEIAQMLSGNDITQAAIEHAKALLNINKPSK